MNCAKWFPWYYSLGVFGVVYALLFPVSLAAQAFEKVELDSLEQEGLFSRTPVKLTGYFRKPENTGSLVPAVVFMHPCNGLVNKKSGRLNRKYVTLANRLRNSGIAVLMVDSFHARGVTEICTTPPKDRAITESTRVQDAYGALKYLRGRGDLAADKIAIVGWGASGTLEAIDKKTEQLSDPGNRGFNAAVAFYPHCASFSPYAPTLVLVGEKDTWNSPDACIAVAKEQEKETVSLEVKVYPDAYHSFDAPAMPLTTRKDVPHLGPVTVGTNPEARTDSHIRVQAFLKRHLGISGASRKTFETSK